MTNERTFSKDKKERGGISLRNLLNKKLKNEKGLTLIELLAVIVILAIIALIAIPAIGSIISNSKSKAILSDATTIIAGAKTAIADGVCDGTATKPCDNTTLGDFVDGIEKDGTYEVKKVDAVKAGTNTAAEPATYKIKYSQFKDLNTKYQGKIGYTDATQFIEQSKITEAMGGSKK